MSLKSTIDLNNLPEHVAIVMDGNGRWAKKQGKLRVFGHQNGVKSVRNVTEAAAEIGVKYLTLYAFSTENWNRPKLEITALMELLVSTIKKETATLMKNNIRLAAIGDLNSLPAKCQNELLTAIEETKNNTRMTLVLALSYSSKWDITNAVKQISQKVKEGILDVNQINDNTITEHLSTSAIPNPELMIRTSGEYRISNFLLWELAYSELYFTETFWPDFSKEEFYAAIVDFQKRERRFGKTSEQLKAK
ncbi:MAG: isoprenyl transferase [Bacteroidia bacterium]|nr:isoprenyl transferase [Bacteroidia bacterium]MCC7534068.1 isoprenyl transferase [Bacteroidia bacterium]